MKIRFTRPWKIYATGDIIEPENDAVAKEFIASGLCVPVETSVPPPPEKKPEANKAHRSEPVASK